MKKKLLQVLLGVIILQTLLAFVFGRKQLIRTISQQNLESINRFDSVYFNWCNGKKNFEGDSIDLVLIDYNKSDVLSADELRLFLKNLPQGAVYSPNSFKTSLESPKGADAYINICSQIEFALIAKVEKIVKIQENGTYPSFYIEESHYAWILFDWFLVKKGSVAGP